MLEALNSEEINRYNRQILLPELSLNGQQKLKSAAVLIIGAGGLGCPILQYLAAAGIGKLGIVDYDKVDESNLHRQILYHQQDIGKPKAKVAAEKIKFLNPFVTTKAYQERFTLSNAEEIVKSYDLIIDGSDNFETRYLVNDVCEALNKAWVFGSIFKFEGQVSVFNYQNGPVYRDVYPEIPTSNLIPDCAQIGTMGILPGIIGLMMANEAIKIICNIGETLSGKLLVYDALSSSTNIYQLKNQNTNNKQNQKVMPSEAEIDLETLTQWKQEEGFILVDIREEWEFEDFNRGGINIPLNLLPLQLASLSEAKKIVCCCNYGNKSKLAVKLIQEAYPQIQVFSLKDGIGDEY